MKLEKSRVELAAKRHAGGYNCCQAVVCTYCDLLGMDEVTAFRASEGFGLGIAGMQETCGSVCAMVFLAGLRNSGADLCFGPPDGRILCREEQNGGLQGAPGDRWGH